MGIAIWIGLSHYQGAVGDEYFAQVGALTYGGETTTWGGSTVGWDPVYGNFGESNFTGFYAKSGDYIKFSIVYSPSYCYYGYDDITQNNYNNTSQYIGNYNVFQVAPYYEQWMAEAFSVGWIIQIDRFTNFSTVANEEYVTYSNGVLYYLSYFLNGYLPYNVYYLSQFSGDINSATIATSSNHGEITYIWYNSNYDYAYVNG